MLPINRVWRTVNFSHNGQTVQDRALVVWSPAKEQLDSGKRKTLLMRLLNALAHIQAQLNQRKYRRRNYVIKRLARVCTGSIAGLIDVELSGPDGALRFAINRARPKAAQALDGKYILATNAPQLTGDTALATFREQDGVEKAIALLKGPWRVRPFFVQTDERIQGLVFFNLVAFLVRAILGLRLHRAGMLLSAERALAALQSLQVVEIGFGDGSTLFQVAEINAAPSEILEKLRLPSPKRYQTDISLAPR